MPVSQVSQIAIGKLRPNPVNARRHSRKQIGQIARSIQQFGFVAPVIADDDGHILAGHGRWLAATELGLRRIPVVVVSGLSDAERRAYLLADNKLTENAGWDRSALATELHQLAPLLSEAGLEIGLTGFETPEIDALMADLIDPEQDPPDEIVELAKNPISRRGDLWLLGRHRLFCGDAKSNADLRKLMTDDQAAMVFADPPFNLPTRSVQGRGKIKHQNFIEGAGELSENAFMEFLVDTLGLASKHSMAGSINFVCIDWRHIGGLLAAGKEVYSELKNLAVWVKTNAGQGSFYRSQHEFIFVFKNGGAPHINNIELGRHGRNRSNVWTYAGVNTFRSNRLEDLSAHPTVKPVALVTDAMRDCSRRGDIVLDPFIGSGTTILAAERVGRRGYGLDIDPRYVDIAVRRWETFTKQDAVLMASGRTFAEVAATRTARKPK
jgi:DNA modification methylase